GRCPLGTRPCWPNWLCPVASQVKKLIRYRNATAPSPDPTPVSSASTNRPPRPARSHAAARDLANAPVSVSWAISRSFPHRQAAVHGLPPRLLSRHLVSRVGGPLAVRYLAGRVGEGPQPVGHHVLHLAGQQGEDPGDQLPPPHGGLVNPRPAGVMATSTARRSERPRCLRARPLRTSRSHIRPAVDGATPSAPARSTRRCGPRDASTTSARYCASVVSSAAAPSDMVATAISERLADSTASTTASSGASSGMAPRMEILA